MAGKVKFKFEVSVEMSRLALGGDGRKDLQKHLQTILDENFLTITPDHEKKVVVK